MTSYYNPYLFIPLVSWLIAQLIKFTIRALKGEINWRLFYSSGGMPSAHSSVVASLVVTTLVLSGVTSPLFGVSAVFAGIVIYDSFGVRRSSGNQAVLLNNLLEKLDHGSDDLAPARLKEVLGHSPREVLAGICLGILVALSLTSGHWQLKTAFLTDVPTKTETNLYFALFVLAIGASLISRLVLSKRFFKQTSIIRSFKTFLSYSLIIAGLAGLFFVLCQYQLINGADARLWPLLVLVLAAKVYFLMFFKRYRHLKVDYGNDTELINKVSRHKKAHHKRKKR